MRLAPADMSGVRKLVKALRAGEAVGMLPDQVPGNERACGCRFRPPCLFDDARGAAVRSVR